MPANNDGPLLIGIDGGTEGIRVGLFTPEGVPVATARESYPSRHERPGWAEQDPDDWWRGAAAGVRRVLAESGVAPDTVAGIGIACTCFTMVCVGADDRPLRPALMWMDVRATEEAATIAESGAEALRYSGFTHASAEWMLSKALWIRRHEPRVFDATTWFADYAEWMAFRLTGERSTSLNSAAIRAYYDRLAGGWPTELWNRVGLSELRGMVADRVLPMGSVVGGLDPRAGDILGLPSGIPVAQGGADAFVAMLGLGVTGPGTLAMVTGSSHVHILQTDTPSYTDGLFGSYTDAVVPGQFTIEGGQVSTGSIVSWYARLLGAGAGSPRDTGQLFAALNEDAARLPPGSDGVLALDYWQGNRTPHVDPHARGMIWGLSLPHGPHHVFRALLESVCYGTESIIRTMRSAGNEVTDVVACGGALNSPLWVQIHADVSGLPIRTTRVPDAVMLGSAVLASVGAGVHGSVAAAADAMVVKDRVVEPRPDVTEQYRPWVDLYLESYDAMRPLLHRAAALADDPGATS